MPLDCPRLISVMIKFTSLVVTPAYFRVVVVTKSLRVSVELLDSHSNRIFSTKSSINTSSCDLCPGFRMRQCVRLFDQKTSTGRSFDVRSRGCRCRTGISVSLHRVQRFRPSFCATRTSQAFETCICRSGRAILIGRRCSRAWEELYESKGGARTQLSTCEHAKIDKTTATVQRQNT
jgi:hypothetical protein